VDKSGGEEAVKKKKEVPVMDDLKEVLIRSVGDTRKCPHCGEEFIPKDKTANDAWRVFKRLFGRKPS
jgi:predicted RNA-binding Zn-ribbon protein involved in translation (DUF1610 family)